MLQPLDISVFGPFQHAWIDQCDEIVKHTGEEMPKEDFVKEYMDIWDQIFKSTTISHMFKKCGLNPINPGVFTDDYFALSIPFSYMAHNISSTLPSTSMLPLTSEDDSSAKWFHELDSDIDSEDSDSDEDMPAPSSSPQPSPQSLVSSLLTPGIPSIPLASPTSPLTFYTNSASSCTTQSQQVKPTFLEQFHNLQKKVTQQGSKIEHLKGHCSLAEAEITELKQKQNL